MMEIIDFLTFVIHLISWPLFKISMWWFKNFTVGENNIVSDFNPNNWNAETHHEENVATLLLANMYTHLQKSETNLKYEKHLLAWEEFNQAKEDWKNFKYLRNRYFIERIKKS